MQEDYRNGASSMINIKNNNSKFRIRERIIKCDIPLKDMLSDEDIEKLKQVK